MKAAGSRCLPGGTEPPSAVRAHSDLPLDVEDEEALGRRPSNEGDLLTEAPPAAAAVARGREARVGSGDQAVRVARVDGEIDECPRRLGQLGPRASFVAACEKAPVRAVEAVDTASRRAQDVEVGLAEQRDRAEGLAGVGRDDQAEARRQVLARAGVPGPEEAVRAHDREAHHVLAARSDRARLRLAGRGAKEPVVRGHEDRAVGGVHT